MLGSATQSAYQAKITLPNQGPKTFADLPYASEWLFLCDSLYFVGYTQGPGDFHGGRPMKPMDSVAVAWFPGRRPCHRIVCYFSAACRRPMASPTLARTAQRSALSPHAAGCNPTW